MNILLVGEESVGIHALQHLARSRHRVVGVAASSTHKYGSPVTLCKVAQKLGFRTWGAGTVKDPAFVEQIRTDGVDVLLNLHSPDHINQAVVRAPKIGSFNLHPGPLPRYAGLNPVSWALYFGEKTHGVTLHWMTGQVDAGPIVYQSIFPVTEVDTGLSVFVRCIKQGLQMVSRFVQTLEINPAALPRMPQNLAQREYFGQGAPDSRLIWSRPAQEVVNYVRACDFYPFPSPWGHPQTQRGSLEIQIVKAARTGVRTNAAPGTVSRLDGCEFVVACADEWISLTKLKVQDKFMNPVEILQIGDHLEAPAASPQGAGAA